MSTAFLFDRYVLKSLSVTTFFVACTLAAIILLTQSLKFLELIIESGASSGTFWALAFLALPRFFEVILPIALMISVAFIYSRMVSDSEIAVMRGAGVSPPFLARPALFLALIVTLLMFFITSWLAPTSLGSMQQLRQVVKAQYSALLFREGVFNEAGKELTIFLENRTSDGVLEGLLIHDSRKELDAPVTIIAKRGVIVSTQSGQQIVVYEGSRQDFNAKTGGLNRLDFERYSIDLPDPAIVGSRWKEPDERTLWSLMNTDYKAEESRGSEKELKAEIHRRIATPLLSFSYTGIVLCFLLLGPLNRRGQGVRIFSAVVSVILLQGVYLSAVNLAQKTQGGIYLMYMLTLIPIFITFFILSPMGEAVRNRIMRIGYKKTSEPTAGRTS